MRLVIAIAAALVAGGAMAQVVTTPMPGTPGRFSVALRPPFDNTPDTQYGPQALIDRALKLCPAGYDKLAERVRRDGDRWVLSWEIQCVGAPVAAQQQ